MGIHIGLGLNSRRAGASVPPIITAPAQFAPGDWSVSTGLAASQIVLNVTALPANGGSAITALEYSIDAGATWTALSGAGTGSRTLTMAAASTSYTFVLRAVNAIGNGPASASKSATSGAAGAGPVISDVVYNTTTNTLTFKVSKPVTLFATHNTSATPMTAAAIEAAAEVTQVLAAGDGFIDLNDDFWGYDTFYIHVAAKDSGGLTDTIAPIKHIRPIPGFTERWTPYAVGNTFTELAAGYTRNAGSFLADIVADAAAPAGKGCDISSSTANERFMHRNDIDAALALRTTERIQWKGLVRMASLSNGRAWLGFSVDIGNLHTGIVISRTGSVWTVSCQLEGNPSSLSNSTAALTGLSDGDLVRVIGEIDGLDVKVKAYLDGDPVPGTWTTRTAASAISLPELHLGARVSGVNMRVLGYTLAIGADAPEV